MPDESHTITGLLHEWRSGETNAANRVMELVYGELHQMAERQSHKQGGEITLQTTALVHELYLRLRGSEPIAWQDRAHFFAIAATQLRRILIDHARKARSQKRGGDQVKVSLCDFDGGVPSSSESMLALNEALERLENLDNRAARVIELRFFGGLDESESAEALGISLATVKRDWVFARAWLASQLI